jgi:hypothetical protein
MSHIYHAQRQFASRLQRNSTGVTMAKQQQLTKTGLSVPSPETMATEGGTIKRIALALIRLGGLRAHTIKSGRQCLLLGRSEARRDFMHPSDRKTAVEPKVCIATGSREGDEGRRQSFQATPPFHRQCEAWLHRNPERSVFGTSIL